jgi:hypothetical protein
MKCCWAISRVERKVSNCPCLLHQKLLWWVMWMTSVCVHIIRPPSTASSHSGWRQNSGKNQVTSHCSQCCLTQTIQNVSSLSLTLIFVLQCLTFLPARCQDQLVQWIPFISRACMDAARTQWPSINANEAYHSEQSCQLWGSLGPWQYTSTTHIQVAYHINCQWWTQNLQITQ